MKKYILSLILILLISSSCFGMGKLVVENELTFINPTTVTQIADQKGLSFIPKDTLSLLSGSAVGTATSFTENFDSSQGTISIWYYPYVAGNAGQLRYLFDCYVNVNSYISVYVYTDNYLYFAIRCSDGTRTTYRSFTSILPFSWNHIVCTWSKNATVNGSNYQAIYLNGVLGNASTTAPLAMTSIPSTFSIGSNYLGNNSANGILAYKISRMWMSATDVTADYNSGAGSKDFFTVCPNCVALGLTTESSTGIKYHHVGASVSAIADGATEDALTVATDASKRFTDNDRVVVSAGNGYSSNILGNAFVDGTPSSASMAVDDGAGAVPAFEPNIVVNSSFESGVTTGWTATISTWVGGITGSVAVDSTTSGTGIYSVKLSTTNSNEVTTNGYTKISQSVTPDVDTYYQFCVDTKNNSLSSIYLDVQIDEVDYIKRLSNITEYSNSEWKTLIFNFKTPASYTTCVISLTSQSIPASSTAMLWLDNIVLRKITTLHKAEFTVSAIGDSQVGHLGTFANMEDDYYLSWLSTSIRKAQLSKVVVCPPLNAGVAGNTSTSVLARVQADIVDAVPKPEICYVAVGTNDAGAGTNLTTFYNNIVGILQILKAGSVVPIMFTIPPRTDEVDVTPYNTQIINAASAESVELFDAYTIFTAYPSWQTALIEDDVHYNTLGHIILGKELGDVLVNYIQSQDAGGDAGDVEKIGKSFGSYYAYNNGMGLINANDFSYSWRMKGNPIGSDTLIARGSTTLNHTYSILHIQSGDVIRLNLRFTSNITVNWSSTGLADNRWHHVAITCDRDGNATLYIDGILQGGQDISSQAGDFNTYYQFQVCDSMLGLMSDIKYYVGGLWSAAEILFQATNPYSIAAGAGTITEAYACTEGTGTTITASVTPATNNLTLSNALAWNQSAFVSRNLVVDGMMENGGVGGWTPASCTFTKNLTNPIADSADGKLLNTGAEMGTITQTIPIASGDNLYFHCLFKGAATPDATSILVNGDGVAAQSMTVAQAGISAGATSEVEFCMEAGDTSFALGLGSGSVTNAESGNIDNIEVLASLVDNGSMEGGADPPTSWTQEASATVVSDTSPHAGTNCMKITAGADNVGASQAITLVTGQYYSVGAYLKANAGSTIGLYMDYGDGNVQTIGTTTSTSWQRVRGSFKALGVNGVMYYRCLTTGFIGWTDDAWCIRDDSAEASSAVKGGGIVPQQPYILR